MECKWETTADTQVFNTSEMGECAETREVIGIFVSAFLLFLIIILSVVGNIAVIVVILKTPRLREKTSNIFLINLSLTDTLNAILVMPFALISLIADEWLLGTFLCYAQCAFNYWFIIVSMLTLAMISIDGYYAVLHPMQYLTIVTPKATKVAVCYAWLQGCIFAVIPIVLQWIVYDYWEVTCAIDWDSYSEDGALTYVVIACVVCFLIPATVMSFCYTKICRIAREKAVAPAQTAGMGPNVKKNRQTVNERRIIQNIAIVVAVFFLCMTPFCVTKLIKIITGTKALPPYLYLVSSLFGYLASATNPFIYAIIRRDFRRAFRQMFCRGRHVVSGRFGRSLSGSDGTGMSTSESRRRRVSQGVNNNPHMVSDMMSNATDNAAFADKVQ